MPNEARRLQPEQRAPVGNRGTRRPRTRPQTTIFLSRFFRNLFPLPKQILLFTAIFLITTLCAFTQEQSDGKKAAIGLGAEFNFNSNENFAGGASLGFDINLPYSFAAGVTAMVSHNFDNVLVLEPSALFRWYFLGVKEQKHSGLFAQADAGAYVVLADEEIIPLFAGGVRVGFRVSPGSFYVEPYGRAGYPYIFGIGLAAGLKF